MKKILEKSASYKIEEVDNNNEYVSPIAITTASKIIKLFNVLFVNERILFGKKFLNIEIYYIQNWIIKALLLKNT